MHRPEVNVLRVDDVERLSRYQAGELSETEAAQVRAELAQNPELRTALARLEALDALAAGVADAPVGLPPEVVERATRAALAGKRAWPAWGTAAIPLGSVLLLAGLGWQLSKTQSVGATPSPAAVHAVPESERVSVPHGHAVPLDGAVVVRDGADLVVTAGTALIDGQDLTVRCGPAVLKIDGRALVSAEPEAAVLHVTRSADTNPNGDSDMQRLKANWLIAPPSTAGVAVLLAVLSGTASAGDGPKILPGNVWLGQARVPPDGRALSSRPPPAVPAAEKPPEAKKLMLSEGMIPYLPLREVLMTVGPALAKCFEKGRAQAPGLEGDVTLVVTVVPAAVGGRAEDVQVEGYTLQHPFVTSCIVEAMGALKYPAPSTPRAKVIIPLSFHGRGGADSGAVEVFMPGSEGQPATMHMPDRPALVEVRTNDAAFLGAANAPVTVVALLDFECTFCQRSWPILESLMQQYDGRVRFAVLEHPLPSHPGAKAAAAAAIAAQQQGKFREFATLLFSEQTMHDAAGLDALARRAGLDLQRFRQAISDGSAARVVDAHVAEADRVGAKGTPTFFINGKEIVGARPLATFQQELDQALAVKR